MKITKTYFMLFATQMDRTVGFYRDALGLQVRMQSPYWSELTWGDATIALHGREESGVGETETMLGFEVDDLEAACKAVEGAGGRVVEPPVDRPDEGIQLARAADPDGNVFTLGTSAR
jgi:lactoylglutathione lyase